LRGGWSRVQLATWFLALLVLSGWPVAGHGEEQEDARARAVRLTSEGAAAYKAEDYAKAFDRFGAAYRAFPAPPLLLNLSRTELKLSRCAEALRYAELFKAAAPDTQAASPDASDAWRRRRSRGGRNYDYGGVLTCGP
jgi:hypothetical protein